MLQDVCLALEVFPLEQRVFAPTDNTASWRLVLLPALPRDISSFPVVTMEREIDIRQAKAQPHGYVGQKFLQLDGDAARGAEELRQLRASKQYPKRRKSHQLHLRWPKPDEKIIQNILKAGQS